MLLSKFRGNVNAHFSTQGPQIAEWHSPLEQDLEQRQTKS